MSNTPEFMPDIDPEVAISNVVEQITRKITTKLEAEYQGRYNTLWETAVLARENAATLSKDNDRLRQNHAALHAEVHGPGGLEEQLKEARPQHVKLTKEVARGDDSEGSCRVALLTPAKGPEEDGEMKDDGQETSRVAQKGSLTEYEVTFVSTAFTKQQLEQTSSVFGVVFDKLLGGRY